MPELGPLPIQDFHGLVKKSLGEDYKVKSVEWRYLTEPGENFGSIVLAIDATVSRDNVAKTYNLVIKLPPKSDYLLDLFNSPLTFKKELSFYKDIVPAYAQVQLESGIKRENLIDIVPRFYGGRLGLKDPDKFDEQGVVVLENLTVAGFKMQDRITGMDRDHMDFAIKGLASFHAVVISLKLNRPEFFERVVMPSLVKPVNDTATKCLSDMLIKALQDIGEFQETKKYYASAKKTIEYAEKLAESEQEPEEPWGTIVHSDFWVNNMMFSYDTAGNIADMKIVDFQLTYYGYGLNDLVFFLISSATREVLDDSLNQMIDYYYESFLKSLKLLKLGTETFTRNKFDQHLKLCAPLKFEQCLRMAGVIQAPRGHGSRENEGKEAASFLNCDSSKEYKEKLFHILCLFDKQGWLIK
ncbi:uncharacterized protein [Prorops nasuta]|uniref:uncharacterized protein n=1 Tax=Prorops nasuta TaxID=863751 RepID=UPI0034CFCB8F